MVQASFRRGRRPTRAAPRRTAERDRGLRVGEVVAGRLGPDDVLAGGGDRRCDAGVAADDGERGVALVEVERCAEERAEVGRRPVAERQRAQHGQRVDAFDHVVPRRLAELFVGGGDVEDVVDDLEHGAVGVAVLGERIDDDPVVAGDDATDAAVP